MTHPYKPTFDPDLNYFLERRKAAETANYNQPTQYSKNGASHLRSGAQTAHKWAKEIPGPYRAVWFAKLDPGGFAVPHIDAGKPFYDRWHIPITPAGFFWEDGVMYEAPEEPFRVRHWLPHAVGNPTDRVRIHLMVDRVEIAEGSPEESTLILTDMIPEIQELIDRI